MARYHLSPRFKGEPRVCSARFKCDYADTNDGQGIEHYPNKAAAMAAHEANLAEELDTMPTAVSKSAHSENTTVTEDNAPDTAPAEQNAATPETQQSARVPYQVRLMDIDRELNEVSDERHTVEQEYAAQYAKAYEKVGINYDAMNSKYQAKEALKKTREDFYSGSRLEHRKFAIYLENAGVPGGYANYYAKKQLTELGYGEPYTHTVKGGPAAGRSVDIKPKKGIQDLTVKGLTANRAKDNVKQGIEAYVNRDDASTDKLKNTGQYLDAVENEVAAIETAQRDDDRYRKLYSRSQSLKEERSQLEAERNTLQEQQNAGIATHEPVPFVSRPKASEVKVDSAGNFTNLYAYQNGEYVKVQQHVQGGQQQNASHFVTERGEKIPTVIDYRRGSQQQETAFVLVPDAEGTKLDTKGGSFYETHEHD